MSKRKPWFKARIMQADANGNVYEPKEDPSDKQRVRITDARELTPEKAVSVILDSLHCDGEDIEVVQCLAESVGMTAAVVNGKVRVRKIKQTKDN